MRLSQDPHGRPICVVTTPSMSQAVGTRFNVLGDTMLSAPDSGITWIAVKTGRPNTVTARRKSDRDWLPVDPRYDGRFSRV